MKQGSKMQDRIKEYNEMEIMERQELPNLYEAIKMAQQGNEEVIDKFFYGKMVIERYPYDGKMTAYEVKQVRFWDRPTDIFLGHIKKRYTKDITIGDTDKYAGRGVSYKFNASNFEESEIDEMFYRYMKELVHKIQLDKFVKDSESKTLNAIRKYIRVDFENNFLKKEANERIGLERKIVDGKVYWVKNKQEEVFFEDIYVGQSDDGEELHFLDIVSHDEVYNYSGIDPTDFMLSSKKFIEENLEDALTKTQHEKWLMLVDYVNKNGVESIIDEYTGKVKKLAISRILYPDKDKSERSTSFINKLIERMNDRIEKKLTDAGMKFVSREEEQLKEAKRTAVKSGQVEVYTGGRTEEEVERYFQQHIDFIFKAHIEGRLTWDKGADSMLPSLEAMGELPFDIYEKWVSGGMLTKKEIIREHYNRDKFKMKAGEKKVIKTIPVKEFEDKNDKYITPEQLKEIRRDSEANKSNK